MNWQLIVLQIRRKYKTMTKVSPLVGISADRLRYISRHGTKTMLWENGDKLIQLHKSLQDKRISCDARRNNSGSAILTHSV